VSSYPQEKTASATKPRLLNNTNKRVQAVERTERTLPAVLSIALTVAGLALMLTTHDATVRMLACCLVANETAKEAGR
jgi:hypothetical protein